MPTMTPVPDDLYNVIKHHLEKSKFTEKDAAEVGKLIKKSIREQHDIE
ncbi:MAG: hypothetical protein Q7J35_08665 [Candidatus Methanoperedens sp.]|nr:hypothetical protein [Candidatus Methanoperedens sp.]